jgi:hypothetical protein
VARPLVRTRGRGGGGGYAHKAGEEKPKEWGARRRVVPVLTRRTELGTGRQGGAIRQVRAERWGCVPPRPAGTGVVA